MLFVNLSQDVLHQVFGLVGAYEIGRLWLCGSLRLIWILSEGHTLLNFDFEYNSRFPLRFPFLISHLSSLHHLAIKYSLEHDKVRAFAPQMPLLPRNLRFLELHQSLAIYDFNAQMKDPSRFSQLHTLVLHHFKKPSGIDSFCDLDLRPLKSLKILKVVQPRTVRPPFFQLHLPSHLVDLSLHQPNLTREWIASLPASLTRLGLSSTRYTDFFDLLPRNLLDLTLYVHNPDGMVPQCHELPRGLVSLVLPCFPSVTPLMISELPRTITSLSMAESHIASDADLLALWSEMPPGLKQMGRWFWPTELTQPLAMALPRSLCQSIPCVVSIDAISSLPKGIEALEVRAWRCRNSSSSKVEYPPHLLSLKHFITSETSLSTLPPTLTLLHTFATLKPMTKEIASLFPKKLQSLRVSTSSQTQSAESWIELPRTIEFLEFKVANWKDALKEPKIAKERAKDLPPFLRELKLSGASLCHDFYFHLPKTLTSLSIIVHDLPSTSYDAFSTFPVLNALSISSETSPTSWRFIASSMPRTITNFTWNLVAPTERRQGTDLNKFDLLLLPRGLLSLSLPASPDLELIVASDLHPFSFIQSLTLGGARPLRLLLEVSPEPYTTAPL